MRRPPLSDTQNTPRPPPLALTVPTSMLVGYDDPMRPARLAIRNAA